jgi:hypothetical protein
MMLLSLNSWVIEILSCDEFYVDHETL